MEDHAFDVHFGGTMGSHVLWVIEEKKRGDNDSEDRREEEKTRKR